MEGWKWLWCLGSLGAVKDRDFGVTGLDTQVFVGLELLLSKVGGTAAALVVVFTED